MRIVDANVLLYAVNADADHHEASRRWLDHALMTERIGLAWVPVMAFARLVTKEGLFPRPLSPAEATDQVAAWIDAPGAVLVNPTAQHMRVLARQLAMTGTGGNLVNDAHLAALALEHRAEIVSYDSDFGRFAGVTWRRPDDLLANQPE